MPYYRRRSYRRTRPTTGPRRMNRRYRRNRRKVNDKLTRVSTMVSRQLIVPSRFITRMRSVNVNTVELPTSITPVTTYTYNLNGLWDIDPALASTDLPGFTAIGGIYNRYRAISCRINITFMNLTGTPKYVGFTVLNTDDSIPASWASYREQEGNKFTRQAVLGPNTGEDAVKTLTMNVSFSKLLGDPSHYKGNLNYSGTTNAGLTTGTNPNQVFPLVLYGLSVDGITTIASTIPFKMQLSYWVEFWDRVNLV